MLQAVSREEREGGSSLLHCPSTLVQAACLGLLGNIWDYLRDDHLSFALVPDEPFHAINGRNHAMGCKRLLDAWHSSILLHRRVCQRCAPFPNERHCTELLEVLVSVWCLNVGWRRCGLGYVGDRCTSWGLACSKNTAFVSLAASLPNHQTLEGLAGRVTLPQDATRCHK